VRKRFHAEIASAAHKAGVDPALVHAVIGVESAYRENAVSPKGAVGLMQVMPETGRRYGVENLTLPSQNIRAGTRYLSDLMRMFNGDLSLVLAAYNAGENAVLRYGGRVPPYPETRQYVPRVLSIYRALSGNVPAQGQ
jgi:soluble lytic murein transglycosylase-like protein